MPISAQPRSAWLSQLREKYHQQPQASLGVLLAPTQTTQPTQTVVTPQPANDTVPDFSTNDQLDVLDRIIKEVAASKVAAEPAAVGQPLTPLSPIQAQMPVTQQPMAVARPVPATQTQVLTTQVPEPVTLEPAVVAPPDPSLISAMPQAWDQTLQTAQAQLQPQVGTVAKETAPSQVVAEAPAETGVGAPQESLTQTNVVEAAASSPVKEVEPPSPEIPLEIASYLQEIKDHQDQLPHEIVVANNDMQFVNQAPALRPMIVLPITQEAEKEGAHKPVSWSVRWLVEWSRMVMRMFAGKVVYESQVHD